MIRAVIDTNVLVSALIAPSGNEALLLLAIKEGFITPCLSEEISAEYVGVLARPKFGSSLDEIAALVNLLQKHGELLHPAPLRGGAPDPGDDKFVACAQASGLTI